MTRVRAGQPSEAEPLTIYLAEDDGNLRSMLSIVLRRAGHRVRESGNAADLLAQLGPARRSLSGALLLLDQRLPDFEGLALIRTLRAEGFAPAFILMSAFGGPALARAGGELGALSVLDKPFDFEELRAVIRRFARDRAPEDEGG